MLELFREIKCGAARCTLVMMMEPKIKRFMRNAKVD